MEKTLLAGYGITNITPDFDVCLSGYGRDEQRHAEGVEHDIFTTCVAVSDGEKTILMVTNDVISTEVETTFRLKEEISQATGIPEDRVYISNTHSHSTTRVAMNSKIPGTEQFRQLVFAKAIEAAKAALGDLAPAGMWIGDQQLYHMAFVRHWLMKDGTYYGPNFGSIKSGFVGHATKADETLMMIRFSRENKQDILMVNWQAHPANSRRIGFQLISPDYVGIVRDRLAEKTGALIHYLPGASGNQICRSSWEEEHNNLNWDEYGEKLAEYALELLPKLEPVNGIGIENTRIIYPARTNHADEDKLEEAREVSKVFREQGIEEGNKLARSYGFTSVYHAGSVLSRPSLGETSPLDMNAFRIGDVGFITGTWEMASTTGISVRENSPFRYTAILCGNSRYVPAYAAYLYGSYESSNTIYAQGTAEEVSQKYMEMLFKVR